MRFLEDSPSSGEWSLHFRDLGNSVLVVEHDKDMMLEADYVIDMGPGAGRHGGHVVAAGGGVQDFVKPFFVRCALLGELRVGIALLYRGLYELSSFRVALGDGGLPDA